MLFAALSCVQQGATDEGVGRDAVVAFSIILALSVDERNRLGDAE